jgi:hypothetical protein
MRTTITLEPDLAARLKRIARERGISFKEAVNGAVRRGLGTTGEAQPYRLPTQRMGLRPGIDLNHALQFAAELEDAETIRKLELRK